MNRFTFLVLLVLPTLAGCSRSTVRPEGPKVITCDGFRSRIEAGQVKSIAVMNSKTVLLTLQSGQELRLIEDCGFDVVAFVRSHAPNGVLIAME